MTVFSTAHLALVATAALALAGCQSGEGPLAALKGSGEKTEAGQETQPRNSRSSDVDVEAPEVFSETSEALWDGRPSLGGVWVASPAAVDPERVIIKNPENGKVVIGALFRRERDNPGPSLQISSDAAAALGLLAGQPANVSVTALRREEAAPEAQEIAATETPGLLDQASTVEASELDPIAGAAAAIDRAEGKDAAAGAVVGASGRRVATTDPADLEQQLAGTATKPATGEAIAAQSLDAPAAPADPAPAAATKGSVIQIGFFSVEANAQRAVDTLAKAGIATTTRKEDSQGKTYWSVTSRGDKALLAKIKSSGFSDAYVIKS